MNAGAFLEMEECFESGFGSEDTVRDITRRKSFSPGEEEVPVPRDELLELAGRQRADGSFGPIKDSSAVRLGSTAHALLQMLLADELRRPLKKQIQRGIEYLLEHARLLQGEENNIAAAICAVIVLSLRYRILAGASADAGRELCATLRELLPERELPERLQQAADEEEIKRILQESHLIP